MDSRRDALLRFGDAAVVESMGSPDTPLDAATVRSAARHPGCGAIASLVDIAGSAIGAPFAFLWSPAGDGRPARGTARPDPQQRACARRVVDGGRTVVVHHGEHDDEQYGPDRVVAFLGAPVARPGGRALGALCLVDRRPRLWTTEEVQALEAMARAIAAELALVDGR